MFRRPVADAPWTKGGRVRSDHLIAMACLAAATACGGTPPAAPALPPTTTTTLFTLTAPTLVAPEEGAVVAQNNPDIPCTFDSFGGYGFSIDFRWTAAASSAGVASYHVFVKHPDASLAAVDTMVKTTSYTHLNCHAFVVPQYLEGWEWRVRAIDAAGTAGPWSETRTFRFVRCQIGRRLCGT
jgi:hypothetical protein